MSWQACKWVKTHTVGSSSAKSVLMFLAEAADDKGETLIGNETVAARTELSLRTVVTAIHLLVDLKLITRERRDNGRGHRTSDRTVLNLALGAINALGQDAMLALSQRAAPAPRASKDLSANAARAMAAPRKSLSATDDRANVQPLHRITSVEPSVACCLEARGREPDLTMWSVRLTEAHDAAGEGLDWTSSAIHSFSDLRNLVEPSSGEPCLWSEVMEAVQATAAKAIRKGEPIRSWLWIRDDALKRRDRRLQGLPAPATPNPVNDHERHDSPAAKTRARYDGYADLELGTEGLAELRRRENAD